METLLNWFKPYLTTLDNHPNLQALTLLLVGISLAKVFEWLLTKLTRAITRRTVSSIDDQVAAAIHGPLFWSVVLLSFSGATLLAQLPSNLSPLLLGLYKSIAVVIWALFLMRLARILLRRFSLIPDRFQALSAQTLPLFENVALLLIIGASLYLLFSAWQIDMTAWLASAGIVGIAVGFAAKDTLANLFAGVFILADAPYRVGDYIVLESSERGEVTHIGLRSTRILTRDDVEVTIPNAIMGNSKITNESGGPYRKFRIRVPVGVAYGSDVEQVRGILMMVADEESGVVHEPEPRVRFRAFGPSSLDFELLCWVEEPMLRGRVVDALLAAIYRQFQEQGIEIPFSQHDIHIKELPVRE